MALVKCRECKETVSDKAKTCPSCGISTPGIQTWVLYISYVFRAVGLAFIAFMLVLLYVKDRIPTDSADVQQAPQEEDALQPQPTTPRPQQQLFDLSRPLYSTDNMIVCPYSLYVDPRLSHDQLARVFGRGSLYEQQAAILGCTKFRAGVRLYAERLDYGLVAISPQNNNLYPYITIEWRLDGYPPVAN